MDSNKDESERCIELAERYISEKKYDEAEKFLRKAKKLYPSSRVDDILAKVATLSKQNQKSEPESEVKRRQNTNKENVRPTMSNDYTKDQLDAVKRVKKCKDYYEMLGVTKEATDSDIKKAYKKLALQLHPDKNKAPGAAEAFKVLGNAVAILIDVEKRKQYDLYGCDEERLQNHHRHSETSHYEYARRFNSDFTAEELFNMFFRGGFPQEEFYLRRNGGRWMRQTESQAQHAHSQQPHGYMTIVQMLPVLLLIVLTMLSSFLISDPVYSLHQSPKYSVPRVTQEHKVPYYVKENFHTEFQSSLRRLEHSVEEEFVNQLKLACFRENSYRESMIWKARNHGSQEMYKSARNIETPACKKLQEMNLV